MVKQQQTINHQSLMLFFKFVLPLYKTGNQNKIYSEFSLINLAGNERSAGTFSSNRNTRNLRLK